MVKTAPQYVIQTLSKLLEEEDYLEIDAKKALRSVGYVLLKMPEFNLEYLHDFRKDKSNWTVILPTQKRNTSQNTSQYDYENLRDHGKRLQKSIAHDEESILAPICAWINKYKLNGLQAYKVALLRSKPKCKRQYYHCDTDAVSSLYQKDIKECHLGVVCAPWQNAKLHMK